MRKERIYIINNQAKTFSEWCKLYDKNKSMVYRRMLTVENGGQGMTLEEALKAPIQRNKKREKSFCKNFLSMSYKQINETLRGKYDV